MTIEEYIEKGPDILEQVQRSLVEDTQNCFKIYIRLHPTCKLRKVRLFIIFRALSQIGRICFSKPDLTNLETSEIGLEIEIYFITENNQLDILKTLEEILEIENKVISEMEKDAFLLLLRKTLSNENSLDVKDVEDRDIDEARTSSDLEDEGRMTGVLKDAKNDQSITLEENQRDALQEIGNIGTGNAANALARMINKRVDINIPSVEIVEQEVLIQSLRKKSVKKFLGWCDFAGQNEGFVLIVTQISDVTKLASYMIDGSDERAKEIELSSINFINDFSDLMQSAFSELIAIIFNHFTMAVGNLLGGDFENNSPQMVVSENDQLPVFFQETIKLEEKDIFVVSTDIIVRDLGITLKMLFMPRKKTLKHLLDALSEFI